VTRAAQPVRPARAMIELFVEAYRLHLLRGLEEGLARCGYGRIAGVDEVGRGSLAGPVVAAAVVLDGRCLVPGVDDSKCLTPLERERAAEAIRRHAVAVAVAAVSPEVIDRINILEATRIAMGEALSRLRPAPDCAVVDAVRLSGFAFPCLPVIRGDCFSYAIACASIVAKVERDRMMVELGREYPQYGFAEHKGYGVPEHLEALSAYGPSPVHRLTYKPVLPRPRLLPGQEARC
jgi:ribonuclease HII